MFIIGDLHQKHQEYLHLISKMDYSVQIGDFGFNYDVLKEVDSTKHKFFFANHDNYNLFIETQCGPNLSNAVGHNLGNYGQVSHGGVEFFFIRGGHSIDKKYRKEWIDWFPCEELDTTHQRDCLEEYSRVLPEIVLTHEPPLVAKNALFTNTSLIESFGYLPTWASNTQKFLNELWKIHQPKLWIFGHMHQNREVKIEQTFFLCLAELAYAEIKKDSVITPFSRGSYEVFFR